MGTVPTFQHFKLEEFECPCCGLSEMCIDFIEELDKAREEADISFVITSGYRCAKHNEEVGGKENSAHTYGLAADIAVNSSATRYKLLQALLPRFRRIGIAKTFIHVDDDYTKPQEVCWLYD